MSLTLQRDVVEPQPAPVPRPPVPRRRAREFSSADLVVVVASAAAALSLVWLVFYKLTLLAGGSGFVICSIGAFFVIYYLANRSLFGHVAAVNRVVTAVVTACAGTVVFALSLVIGWLLVKGFRLVTLHFFTQDQSRTSQLAPASSGGISQAIIGTIEMVGMAVLIGAPAGIVTAIFINEVGGRVARFIRIVVTAMSALPTIVAGLFIFVIFVVPTHHFSGFAGALALSIMLLPNVTRTTEEVLKVVHGSLREASMALGAPQWRTVWSVVLPTARTGIVTAVLLGIARVVGETAPLIVTVLGTTSFQPNPFQPQQALPLFIWQNYKLPVAADVARAFGAGLVLVGLVLVLFVIARLIASMRPGTIHRLIERARPDRAEVPA